VHGRDRKTHIVQKVIQVVNFAATICKNDGSHTIHFIEKAEKSVSLVVTLRNKNDLLDVLRCAASSANTESDMSCRQMLFGQVPSSFWKGGGEQSVLDVPLILFCIRR
jgi:hypothetical protein